MPKFYANGDEIIDDNNYRHVGSTLYILQGAPVDRTYQNVITFQNATAQQNFFYKYIQSRDPNSISTENPPPYPDNYHPVLWIRDGVVNIQGNANYIRGANYMMFANSSYYGTDPLGGFDPETGTGNINNIVTRTASKWQYAFIDDVVYNADGSTTIYYTIDWYQSYQFDMVAEMCFIERAIPVQDSYLYLNDEGIAIGPYKEDSGQVTDVKFTTWWVVVGATVNLSDDSFADAPGMPYFKVYSGLYYFAWKLTDYASLQSKIQKLNAAGKGDAIVSMSMVPDAVIADSQTSGGFLVSTYTTKWATIDNPYSYGLEFDGYKPTMLKLYTYPYQCLRITNNMGNSIDLRYEFMSPISSEPKQLRINYKGSPMPDGKIIMWPLYYNQCLNNLDYSVSCGNYPQCSWSKDVYANWLACQQVKWNHQKDRRIMQANTAQTSTLVNSAIDMGANAVAGNVKGVVGAGIGLAKGTVNNTMSAQLTEDMARSIMAEEREVYDITPPSAQGTVGNDSTLIALDQWGFRIHRMTITYMYARSIDDYFKAYGYKINQVATPVPRQHVNWDYYKCQSAIVSGRAPTQAKELYRKMLNNGVRFWNNQAPGNYNQSNPST